MLIQIILALVATFAGLFLISAAIHMGKFYWRRMFIKPDGKHYGVVMVGGYAKPQSKPVRSIYGI